MFSSIGQWFSSLTQVPPALDHMRLGPGDNENNPLMVRNPICVIIEFTIPTHNLQQIQFFTWDALQEDMTWWKHFEREVPRLAGLGFTQVWLPPMNKAAENVGPNSLLLASGWFGCHPFLLFKDSSVGNIIIWQL